MPTNRSSFGIKNRVAAILVFVTVQGIWASGPQELIPSMSHGQIAKSLSLQEAIHTALQNNLKVTIARSTRDSVLGNVLFKEGSFDWIFSGEVKISKLQSSSVSQQPQLGAGQLLYSSQSTEDSRQLTLGLKRTFTWGGDFNLQYTPFYDAISGTQTLKPLTIPYPPETSSVSTLYPYGGQLSAIYTQPLLQNFGRKTNTTQLIVSRNDARIADGTYQKNLIDLVANVESSYWDLVFAQQNVQNKESSIVLAQKQLEDNRIRVGHGVMAASDLISNEATVSQRKQEILIAKGQLLNARETLLRVLYPVHPRQGEFIATDNPPDVVETQSEDAAIKMALMHRVELKMGALDLESKIVNEDAAKDKIRPQLNAYIGYIGNAANHDVLSDVYADLRAKRYPGYNYGIKFSIPIGNSAAKGSLITARANRMLAELGVQDTRYDIILEVQQTYHQLLTDIEVIKISEEAVRYRQENLEAEQVKFENGTTTNYLVIQRQEELDSALSLRLQAKIAVAKANTSFNKAIGMLLENRKITLE